MNRVLLFLLVLWIYARALLALVELEGGCEELTKVVIGQTSVR